MNSAVKSGKVQLNRTNYFTNLKKKANTRDVKDQINFNHEVINCLDIICNRMAAIETQISNVAMMHNSGMEAVGSYLNEELRPIIIELQQKLGSQDAEEQEGDETMDA